MVCKGKCKKNADMVQSRWEKMVEVVLKVVVGPVTLNVVKMIVVVARLGPDYMSRAGQVIRAGSVCRDLDPSVKHTKI